jgi:hypothetical protein
MGVKERVNFTPGANFTPRGKLMLLKLASGICCTVIKGILKFVAVNDYLLNLVPFPLSFFLCL